MSRKKAFFKTVSIILSLLILLTVLPLGVSAADTVTVTPEAETRDVTLEATDNTKDMRVRTEEGAGLNTIVIDNGDGTHTMTLYDHPVKYVDEKGDVQDISLEIASASDGSYKTKANDIQTVFPKKISDGITLSGNGVSVKLTPGRGGSSRLSGAELRTAEDVGPYISGITADSTVTRLDSETVSYYYDNRTTLEYSLTYTGFKEDIVVSEYTGQTEYHFLLETSGLTLTKIDESYYLTDENGEIKATLGDIIIFTADERNNALGSMTHTTVREDQQYIVTIHIDADYLKDEKTVYPIRIDPTIEITNDGNGASAIQDVTLNQNSGSSGTSGSLYVGKRNTYGISRTLMKFPGLNLNNIPLANGITSAYVEIRDLMCETTNMTVYGYIFDGNEWSESTANWSNVDPNSWTEMPSAYADVCYSNGAAKNPAHRYSIDITQAVKSWKTGFYSQSKGIMLRASDSVESGSAMYKTFASYNRASNKPSLKVNYKVEKARLVGVDATNHDHQNCLVSSQSHITICGVEPLLHFGEFTVANVNNLIDNYQTTIFASRSHAGEYRDSDTDEVIGTALLLNNDKDKPRYYYSSLSMDSVDLSNIDLIMFIGCATGYGGEGESNLVSAAVAKGATTAIGFKETIDCSLANQWTVEMFSLLAKGNTVRDACNVLSTERKYQGTTFVSPVICGDKSNTIK